MHRQSTGSKMSLAFQMALVIKACFSYQPTSLYLSRDVQRETITLYLVSALSTAGNPRLICPEKRTLQDMPCVQGAKVCIHFERVPYGVPLCKCWMNEKHDERKNEKT